MSTQPHIQTQENFVCSCVNEQFLFDGNETRLTSVEYSLDGDRQTDTEAPPHRKRHLFRKTVNQDMHQLTESLVMPHVMSQFIQKLLHILYHAHTAFHLFILNYFGLDVQHNSDKHSTALYINICTHK